MARAKIFMVKIPNQGKNVFTYRKLSYFFQALLRGGLKGRGAYLIKQNASPVAKIPWYETQ